MTNFNNVEYKRVNYDEIKKQIEKLTKNFENSKNYNEVLDSYRKIIEIQNHIEEMYDISDIRNMRNSKDEYYVDEITFWNEYKPKFDILFNRFYELLLTSPYLEELKKITPINFFNTIEYRLKISNQNIVELEKREKELKKEYLKIIRKKIEYKGEEINLSGFSKYFNSNDRKIRKSAHDCYNDFFYEHLEELDTIFEELVKVRNEIAKLCGFNDYSEYSLYKLRRFNYNYDDIKEFRNGIYKYFNNLCSLIKEEQKKNIGVQELTYYDTVFFEEQPKLKYHGIELLNKVVEIFYTIDKDLGIFISNMIENNYIDLLYSSNKINFGITNYLSESQMPVVTGNYRDTIYDVTLTYHECGHAYQKYNASKMDKKYIVSSLLKYPTFEVAEMFSNALHLICSSKSSSLFEKEDFEKYSYSVIKDMILNLPYQALVDEFQETVYKNNYDKEQIRSCWNKLSKKYGLENSNKGHINLDNGGYFYRQSHIFTDPFYYIDYALSYFGALAIWSKCQDDLEVFKNASEVASYYPLNELLKMFEIPNPFEEDSMKNISESLDKELSKRAKKIK